MHDQQYDLLNHHQQESIEHRNGEPDYMKTGMSFGDIAGGGGGKSKRSSQREGGAISTSAFPLVDSHELRYQEH